MLAELSCCSWTGNALHLLCSLGVCSPDRELHRGVDRVGQQCMCAGHTRPRVTRVLCLASMTRTAPGVGVVLLVLAVGKGSRRPCLALSAPGLGFPVPVLSGGRRASVLLSLVGKKG